MTIYDQPGPPSADRRSICPKGHAVLQSDRFCPRCGIETASQCPNGHSVPLTSRYCPECGIPNPNATTRTAVLSQRSTHRIGTAAAGAGRWLRHHLWVPIVGVVAVLALGAGIGYAVHQANSPKEPNNAAYMAGWHDAKNAGFSVNCYQDVYNTYPNPSPQAASFLDGCHDGGGNTTASWSPSAGDQALNQCALDTSGGNPDTYQQAWERCVAQSRQQASTSAPPTTYSPPTTSSTPASSAAGVSKGLQGTWTRHDTTGLTIDASGEASLGVPDFTACPTCGEANAPTNMLTFTLTSNDGRATGSVTSVTDPSDPITDSGLKASVGEAVSVAPINPQGLGPGSDDQLTLEISGVKVTTFCGPSAGGACGA